MMGPGYPIATQSNFQSRTDFLTKRTILAAVMVGPDGILRGSFSPVASSLMFVPAHVDDKYPWRFYCVWLAFTDAPYFGCMKLPNCPRATGGLACPCLPSQIPTSLGASGPQVIFAAAWFTEVAFLWYNLALVPRSDY